MSRVSSVPPGGPSAADYTATRAANLDNVGKTSLISPNTAVLLSNDAEVSTTATSYTKKKEDYMAACGTYTIQFDMKASGGQAKGKIYINGAAAGTERTTVDTTYATYSENLFVKVGDLVQIYLLTNNASYPTYARNFRMCGVIGYGVGVVSL